MRKVFFHSFRMGDVEDPEIYAAQPIYEWQQTEQGKWVMEHCADPTYNIGSDPNYMGYKITLSGELEDQDAVFHELKWGSNARTMA
jgi:hypothetical protein